MVKICTVIKIKYSICKHRIIGCCTMCQSMQYTEYYLIMQHNVLAHYWTELQDIFGQLKCLFCILLWLLLLTKYHIKHNEGHVTMLGMCISITEADAIRISMHSQWCDTLNIHMKQLAMRYDSPLLRCSSISIRFDTMRFDAIWCNGKNMIAFIYLVQTDSKS